MLLFLWKFVYRKKQIPAIWFCILQFHHWLGKTLFSKRFRNCTIILYHNIKERRKKQTKRLSMHPHFLPFSDKTSTLSHSHPIPSNLHLLHQLLQLLIAIPPASPPSLNYNLAPPFLFLLAHRPQNIFQLLLGHLLADLARARKRNQSVLDVCCPGCFDEPDAAESVGGVGEEDLREDVRALVGLGVGCVSFVCLWFMGCVLFVFMYIRMYVCMYICGDVDGDGELVTCLLSVGGGDLVSLRLFLFCWRERTLG